MSQPKKSIEEITMIVKRVAYHDWRFHVCSEGDAQKPTIYLVIEFTEPCIVTGKLGIQRSRKWLLSPYMTDSEIVQTCFLAVKTAVEHEMRENFRYMTQLVFGPHFDVYALAGLAASPKATDVRESLVT